MILALGNPGADYDATRHNVGWWVADRLSYDWDLGGFSRHGKSAIAEGRVGDFQVRVVKPLTYMNRSGAVLHRVFEGDPAEDLMVVVDDVHLAPGRLRLRPRGSAGGHNGLESIEGVLGSREYPRLRVGVGEPPSGWELADWVLSPLTGEDEESVVARLGDVTDGLRVWLDEGLDAAMNRLNG